MVNFLEFEALKRYLGEETAKEICRGKQVYPWVYEKVLAHEEQIADILNGQELLLEPR